MTATQKLVSQFWRYISDPKEYRPGIIRQMHDPRAYLEDVQGIRNTLAALEAMLSFLERADIANADPDAILAALEPREDLEETMQSYRSLGVELGELEQYLGGMVFLCDETSEDGRMYSIGLDSALYEAVLHAKIEADSN